MLLRYTYLNNIIDFIKINPTRNNSSISNIFNIEPDATAYSKVTKEGKIYSEDFHIQEKYLNIIELYNELKDYLLSLNDTILIKPVKTYIAFKINNTNFCDIEVYTKHLRLTLNFKKGQLRDPAHITRDISNIGKAGNGDYL